MGHCGRRLTARTFCAPAGALFAVAFAFLGGALAFRP
jgi:hypothetical protein